MIQSFTINGKLPGLNQLFGAANANRFVGADMKRKETARCAWAAKAAGLRMIDNPVEISFEWVEPDCRRDVDNVASGAKFILDGLVQAQILPNDSRAWVRSIFHSFPLPDKANPRIEVTIREIQ